MSQHTPHAMYATPNHDELSRESFVRDLMTHVTRDLMPGKKKLYEAKVKPAFIRAHNRPPKDRHEVRRAMEKEDFNQVWGALRRTTQEMMFDVIGESVERQLPELIDRAGRIGSKLGTLTLDPELEIPRYHTAVVSIASQAASTPRSPTTTSLPAPNTTVATTCSPWAGRGRTMTTWAAPSAPTSRNAIRTWTPK